MRNLFYSAALMVGLATCAGGAPALAQQCMPVALVLERIEEVRPLGVRVVTFPRNEALAVLGVLSENGAAPPAGLNVDAIIMLVGDRAGVLLFIDGDKTCHQLPLPLKAVDIIEQAVRGRAV